MAEKKFFGDRVPLSLSQGLDDRPSPLPPSLSEGLDQPLRYNWMLYSRFRCTVYWRTLDRGDSALLRITPL